MSSSTYLNHYFSFLFVDRQPNMLYRYFQFNISHFNISLLSLQESCSVSIPSNLYRHNFQSVSGISRRFFDYVYCKARLTKVETSPSTCFRPWFYLEWPSCLFLQLYTVYITDHFAITSLNNLSRALNSYKVLISLVLYVKLYDWRNLTNT
jgi:hypothetical protein